MVVNLKKLCLVISLERLQAVTVRHRQERAQSFEYRQIAKLLSGYTSIVVPPHAMNEITQFNYKRSFPTTNTSLLRDETRVLSPSSDMVGNSFDKVSNLTNSLYPQTG